MSGDRLDRLRAGLAVGELEAIARGEHRNPHRVLGPRAVEGGIVVRALEPTAVEAWCVLPDGGEEAMQTIAPGVYAVFLAGREPSLTYRLRFRFAEGEWTRDDPYRFLPTVGDQDLHYFGEGTHRRIWQVLGAHPRQVDGVDGVAFAVWAPNARRVSVVGDFCWWDGRRLPMRALGGSGVFELFVPGVSAGAVYKYEILTREGAVRLKTDPYAQAMELAPGTASRVVASSYVWGDFHWMRDRPTRDWSSEPMSIYEVHLGSWARIVEEGGRALTYRELAPRLIEHVKQLGFTHLELLPIAEHPFTGSWGYQITGYYAPTARYGTPDDFRYFVDHCHQAGIGVILDWVPAHFPKDDYALRRFDGSALYEHADPRRGEHPDWGTLVFNHGRNEVRNFLIGNALYWLDEFHVDGLRVDAVASMLYLDYSREPGQWVPNRFGGREDLEAVEFLRGLNDAVAADQPGCFTVAEESTSWPKVTHPPREGGLGFTFKWNMGWMHDTLAYFRTDPIFRTHHHDQLTFAMMYEYSERFIMPLSHDEVVHGKGSLLNKMPGDAWQRFANLRALLAYQYTRPGKQLVFMGAELAADREWNHDTSLDWHTADEPMRAAFGRFLRALGRLYRDTPPLWRRDHYPDGFRWLECCDRTNSVSSYVRYDGDAHVVVILNLTPAPRADYRVGLPAGASYRLLLSTDAPEFGGSGMPPHDIVTSQSLPWHGQPYSAPIRLPPLGVVVYAPMGG